MNKKNIQKLIKRAKEAARLLPYLLPALVLALSLASSLLVGSNQANAGGGASFMGSPPPPPPDTLNVRFDKAQNSDLKPTDNVVVTTERVNKNNAPIMTPNPWTYPLDATVGVPINILMSNVTDPESNAFTLTVPANTDHGTASISGLMLTFTPLSIPASTYEHIFVTMTDSYGASSTAEVVVHVI